MATQTPVLRNAEQLIAAFRERRVLIVGDTILDVYEKGTTDKLCREAPVPVVNLEERTFSAGGAANTAVNVAALGGHASFLTVLGDDENGSRIVEVLASHAVRTDPIVRARQRKTISKTRVCAGSSILVRVDAGNIDGIDAETAGAVIERFRDALDACDVVVLSDYGYGLFTGDVIHAIHEQLLATPKPLIVDSKQPERFRDLAPLAVKPNYAETVHLLGLTPARHDERIRQVIANGDALLERTGARFVAATVDMDGTVLLERGQDPYLISCIPRDDRQTIGAGDSFVGALALSVAAGASPRTSTRIAAAAAAVVIGKDGTGVCSGDELHACLHGPSKRVTELDELSGIVRELKEQKRRIVFTNGCFDLLHRGHVDFLRQAKALGDVLIVALNDDESIHRIKGDGRPVNSLEDRMEVLAGLEAVDLLVAFDGESPTRVLQATCPDVFAKGGTYSVDSLPEAALVESLGGEVEIIPFGNGMSTTRLIERIQHPAVLRDSVREQRAL